MAKNITFIFVLIACLATSKLAAQAGGSYSGPGSVTAVTPTTDTIDSHGDHAPGSQPREVEVKPGKNKNAPTNATAANTLLYPNPTNGIFFVEDQNGGEVEVTVYSLSGVVITRQRALERCTIDLNEQLTGIYLVQIKTSQGVSTQKVAYFK